MIDRYLSSLEEFSSFLLLVQQTLRTEHRIEVAIGESPESLPFNSTWLQERRNLEATRTQSKIQRQQKLCASFSLQFEALIQTVIDGIFPFLQLRTGY